MSRYLALHAFALICALVCSFEANAIPVTPGGYENVEGASNNCIPFTCRGVNRYQQIYDAAGFNGASGILGAIAFRLDEADQFQDGPFGTIDNGSFSLHLDLLVTLSHTSETSTTVLNQLVDGSDPTVVWDGFVDWNAVQLPGGGLNAFDLIIDFNDLFAYDGAQSLLLDIQIRNADAIPGQVSPRFLDAAGFPPGSGPAPFGRVWTEPGLTGFSQSYGLVTQFDFVHTVPEPGTLLLLLTGLISLLLWRRRSVPQLTGAF
jgi:PEP-CTERM motif